MATFDHSLDFSANKPASKMTKQQPEQNETTG